MIHGSKHVLALVLCLAALAGYVDALGFISMGGFFASFMSGNSTRLGVLLVSNHGQAALLPAGLIVLFVAGVVLGSLVAHVSKWPRIKTILILVTTLLLMAALLQEFTGHLPAMIFIVMAMGAINTLFERDGEVSVAVTYMTGTLVRMGQRIAAALTGGPRFGWVRYALIWGALVVGACAGTAVYAVIGLSGIWVAVIGSSILMMASYRLAL